MGRAEKFLEHRTDSKNIAGRICKQPGDRHKIHDGLDLGLLTLKFLAR